MKATLFMCCTLKICVPSVVGSVAEWLRHGDLETQVRILAEPHFLRLSNHRNHIKKGVSSCEVTEHFFTRTHDFDNNVTITIIEQIKKDNLETDKKREVLREK